MGEVPAFTYYDFSTLAANPAKVLKNDSDMYTEYTTGLGGVCDLWDPDVNSDGTPAGSYWCGNASSGGWAEVDNACAKAGQLQLPVGMTYDTTDPQLKRFARWSNASGAIIHAWHSQSWAMHMFNVSEHDTKAGSMEFAGGGWQGGRNWCSCAQCSYAAPWCGDKESGDDRLISGSWYVENVKEELDVPGEFWYDEATQELFVWPNVTHVTARSMGPPSVEMVVPVLQTLIRFTGTAKSPVKGVTIQGVSFRDAAYTFMERFGVPSGGDWSLYRGGAIFIEGAERLTLSNGLYKRLDGNAIFLSGWNRNVSIVDNEMVFIGDNAIASWGKTQEWDGRGGDQPRFTRIANNYVHELAFFEKQSSFYFMAKTAQATVENNIVFNIPRAGTLLDLLGYFSWPVHCFVRRSRKLFS